MTTAARLIQAPIALIASPQAMAPSHHGHNNYKLELIAMQYYDHLSRPIHLPAYLAEAPVDPIGLAPKTVVLTD
jgi:hypothetical protein